MRAVTKVCGSARFLRLFQDNNLFARKKVGRLYSSDRADAAGAYHDQIAIHNFCSHLILSFQG